MTATQAAIALATVHNIDEEGYPTIAHTDIAPAQFIKVNDTYKLNDFNRARFIAYRHTVTNHSDENGTTTGTGTADEMCPYYIGSNPGKNRSPEEYNYELQTEKVRGMIPSTLYNPAEPGEKNANDLRPFLFSRIGGCLLVREYILYVVTGGLAIL